MGTTARSCWNAAVLIVGLTFGLLQGGPVLAAPTWAPGANGSHPPNSVASEGPGVPRFVCRLVASGQAFVGTLAGNACLVLPPGSSTLMQAAHYDVLVAAPGTVRWVNADPNRVPPGVVNGAQGTTGPARPLCRGFLPNQWLVGSLNPASPTVCTVGPGVNLKTQAVLVDLGVPGAAALAAAPVPTPATGATAAVPPPPAPAPAPAPAAPAASGLRWAAATTGNFPADSVAVGTAASYKVYMCRANIQGFLYTGDMMPGSRCFMPFGPNTPQGTSDQFEVLAGNAAAIKWTLTSNGAQIPGALSYPISGGKLTVSPCRGTAQNETLSGTVFDKVCVIIITAKPVTLASYEVPVVAGTIANNTPPGGAAPIPPAVPPAQPPATVTQPPAAPKPPPVAPPAVVPLHWAISAPGQTPPGVILGGTVGGQPAAVCRVLNRSQAFVGTMTALGCTLDLNGGEFSLSPNEVLVGNGPAGTWVASQGSSIPNGAFVAGQFNGPVHVCRARVGPDLRVGRTAAAGCQVVLNGTAHTVSPHEVLIGQ